MAAAQGVPAAADTADTLVRLELRDGSSLVGRIVSEEEDIITFVTASGMEMRVQREQVLKIERLQGEVVDGAFRRFDPNQTRLLFAPTARPLRDGQGYFADYYLFFPFVAYGVGDWLSLAGGMTLFPGSEQLVYLAPKATVYNTDNLDAAVGVFAVSNIGFDGTVGLVYGTTTYGPSYYSVTGGIGFAFALGDEFEMEDSPLILLGGEYQLTNSFKLITENYWLPAVKEGVALSLGLRFFGERLAADLGLITVPAILDEAEGFPFFPLVSFAYNFGY